VGAVQQIQINETGIAIRSKDGSSSGHGMTWAEVYQISFHRLDAITSVVDYLIFDFEWGEFLETHNHMSGWNDLIEGLPKYLPISLPNWREQIAEASPRDAGMLLFHRSWICQ
jgi:hypothetical protein